MTQSLQVVVDAQSAKLGLAGHRETQLAIDADHSGICKFEAADDRYEPVGGQIKELVGYITEEAKRQEPAMGTVSGCM